MLCAILDADRKHRATLGGNVGQGTDDDLIRGVILIARAEVATTDQVAVEVGVRAELFDEVKLALFRYGPFQRPSDSPRSEKLWQDSSPR